MADIHSEKQPTDTSGYRIQKSVIIDRSPEELYAVWRNFGNLAQFMVHLESVETLSNERSRWRVKGPNDRTVEYEAEIIEDIPGERISWRSLEEADVENSGSVLFRRAPGGRGTEVQVTL